jgi:hypothetical protein
VSPSGSPCCAASFAARKHNDRQTVETIPPPMIIGSAHQVALQAAFLAAAMAEVTSAARRAQL